MKALVLVLGIGRYIELADDLIASFNQFSNDNKIEFFLFTDSPHARLKSDAFCKIRRFYQEDRGWPDNSLLRYRMFCSVTDEILSTESDVVVFANTNLRMVDTRFFSRIYKASLFFARHPGYSGLRNLLPKPFDTNKKSTSCCSIYNVLFSKYVQGTLWGGETNEFIKMVKALNDMCEADLLNGTCAKVFDESYLNKYALSSTNHILLGPKYHWPEDWFRLSSPHIVSVDKTKIFGKKFMKELKG